MKEPLEAIKEILMNKDQFDVKKLMQQPAQVSRKYGTYVAIITLNILACYI